VFCTPDMHRIHHSVVRRETDSNYGFFLSVWDRLFGTYRADPEAGHDRMEIGLAEYRDPARLGLVALIAMPFRRLARGNARDR
jgi:sterol desaturase/sphingolipid hydroxylase (fatty acid hydroxylase superfamily)